MTTLSHLPPEILVVSVTHIQALGGEGVGLDLDIRTGDLIDEAGLADIGETSDDQCTCISVN